MSSGNENPWFCRTGLHPSCKVSVCFFLSSSCIFADYSASFVWTVIGFELEICRIHMNQRPGWSRCSMIFDKLVSCEDVWFVVLFISVSWVFGTYQCHGFSPQLHVDKGWQIFDGFGVVSKPSFAYLFSAVRVTKARWVQYMSTLHKCLPCFFFPRFGSTPFLHLSFSGACAHSRHLWFQALKYSKCYEFTKRCTCGTCWSSKKEPREGWVWHSRWVPPTSQPAAIEDRAG